MIIKKNPHLQSGTTLWHPFINYCSNLYDRVIRCVWTYATSRKLFCPTNQHAHTHSALYEKFPLRFIVHEAEFLGMESVWSHMPYRDHERKRERKGGKERENVPSHIWVWGVVCTQVHLVCKCNSYTKLWLTLNNYSTLKQDTGNKIFVETHFISYNGLNLICK